jgi:hypothetical protein
VDVGIDERAEGGRALQGRLQGQPELGGNGVVRSEPGGGDHLVGLHGQAVGVSQILPVPLVADQPDPLVGRLHRADAEAGDQLDAAGVDLAALVDAGRGWGVRRPGAALADQRPR